jgi:hypothetical protein
MMTIDDARAIKGRAQEIKISVPTPIALLKLFATFLVAIPWVIGWSAGKGVLGAIWLSKQGLWVTAWLVLALREGFWTGAKAVPKEPRAPKPGEPAWMTQDWGNGSPDDEEY